MTYNTNEYIFLKVLVLKTLIIQTETFSPQYKYPFGLFSKVRDTVRLSHSTPETFNEWNEPELDRWSLKQFEVTL